MPLALFQIIPPEEVELYHAMDNVDLQWPQPCPRLCPASPTIYWHNSTFLPLPLSTSRGEAVHVVSDSEGSFSTLPHQCQGILPRIAINVLLFDHFYEPTKYCSKCIAFTNSVRHSLTHHLFVQVILFCEFYWGKVIAATYESRSSHRQ